MMKKIYSSPAVEALAFVKEDILFLSNELSKVDKNDNVVEDDFNPLSGL